jgi:hypothetical protein
MGTTVECSRGRSWRAYCRRRGLVPNGRAVSPSADPGASTRLLPAARADHHYLITQYALAAGYRACRQIREFRAERRQSPVPVGQYRVACVGRQGQTRRGTTVEQGREAAQQAGLIMLTKIRTALGRLDRGNPVVKVLGMVNSAQVRRPATRGQWIF